MLEYTLHVNASVPTINVYGRMFGFQKEDMGDALCATYARQISTLVKLKRFIQMSNLHCYREAIE